ncbi:MAG: sucrose phosphorylase [Actinomycetota bacterium]
MNDRPATPAPLRNQPQLITYVDRLAGDLAGLGEVMRGHFAGAFGGVHLLPFFPPIDGADAGFDPIDHTMVDPRLGDWSDVGALGADFEIMADLIVNHVSSGSEPFLDWQAKGDASEFAGMFLTKDMIFPGGASEEELAKIYRPRPWPPFTTYEIDGEPVDVWTTFTSDQIDINVEHPAGWAYLMSVLDRLAEGGVRLVRLDAVGYAIKRRGTSCFMLPEAFDFIARLRTEAHRRGMHLLVEIHSYFGFQMEIAASVDFVYDFALPPLVLHAIHAEDATPLEHWLAIRPTNCVTVLDTHDGIGVVDVAPEGDKPGLLEPDQVDALVEAMHDASDGRSRESTGAAASNLDLYQVNGTYFEALGSDDDAQIIARLIQVFAPGIPQIYYAGVLAAANDMALLRRTGVGRDINRPYHDEVSLAVEVERPVVQSLLQLLRWRAVEGGLFGGDFSVVESPTDRLVMRWTAGDRSAELRVDLTARRYDITVDGSTVTSVDDLSTG